jgi:hypothetical protein
VSCERSGAANREIVQVRPAPRFYVRQDTDSTPGGGVIICDRAHKGSARDVLFIYNWKSGPDTLVYARGVVELLNDPNTKVPWDD